MRFLAKGYHFKLHENTSNYRHLSIVLIPPKATTGLLEQFSKVSQDLGLDSVTPVNPSDIGAACISFTSEYIEMGIDGDGHGRS